MIWSGFELATSVRSITNKDKSLLLIPVRNWWTVAGQQVFDENDMNMIHMAISYYH